MKKLLSIFAWLGIFRLAFSYLDPGTGSLVIQLLIGGLVGFMVIFRGSFNSILYMLGIKKPPQDDDDDIESIDEIENNNN